MKAIGLHNCSTTYQYSIGLRQTSGRPATGKVGIEVFIWIVATSQVTLRNNVTPRETVEAIAIEPPALTQKRHASQGINIARFLNGIVHLPCLHDQNMKEFLCSMPCFLVTRPFRMTLSSAPPSLLYSAPKRPKVGHQ